MKYVLLLSLFCFCNSAKCQSLTLSDLLKIVKSDPAFANNQLAQKGWEYYQTIKEDSVHSVDVIWNYKPWSDDTVINASAWLNVWYVRGYPKGLNFQFSNYQLYRSLLNAINKTGAKIKGSETYEDKIVSTYTGSNYVFILKTNSQKVKYSKYSISIEKKSYYLSYSPN